MTWRYHRKNSLRLSGYDYSLPGAYFITIDVKGHQCVLGEVINKRFLCSLLGEIVQAAWQDLPNHYPHITLDAFCVMPNHVHGIIVINDPDDIPYRQV